MTDTAKVAQLLSGYRVLDLTSSIGALCGKLLGDLGMDVHQSRTAERRSDAQRTAVRQRPSHREGSLRFAYLNAGKRSITLDLAKPQGRNLLLDLVERADVMVEDFSSRISRGIGFRL